MAAKDQRTIFIRGISFDANEKDLEDLFSDVGPVKQCFLVRVKDQPKHRGFGFVQYSLPEDAERAVTECNGKRLKGRKLQVRVWRARQSPFALPQTIVARLRHSFNPLNIFPHSSNNNMWTFPISAPGGAGGQARLPGGAKEETQAGQRRWKWRRGSCRCRARC